MMINFEVVFVAVFCFFILTCIWMSLPCFGCCFGCKCKPKDGSLEILEESGELTSYSTYDCRCCFFFYSNGLKESSVILYVNNSKNNLNMNYGPYDRNVNVLNIQPVIPFANGKIITRTIIPMVSIPDFASESGMETTGLGDIVLTGFYVPESKGLIWGAGPVVEFPTGGSTRGSQKWSAGPSLVGLIQKGDWTFGALWNALCCHLDTLVASRVSQDPFGNPAGAISSRF